MAEVNLRSLSPIFTSPCIITLSDLASRVINLNTRFLRTTRKTWTPILAMIPNSCLALYILWYAFIGQKYIFGHNDMSLVREIMILWLRMPCLWLFRNSLHRYGRGWGGNRPKQIDMMWKKGSYEYEAVKKKISCVNWMQFISIHGDNFWHYFAC